MPDLLELKLPIPDIAIQDRIARIEIDIGLLRSVFQEMQDKLGHDWNSLGDIGERIDGLKAVLILSAKLLIGDTIRHVTGNDKPSGFPSPFCYESNPAEGLTALVDEDVGVFVSFCCWCRSSGRRPLIISLQIIELSVLPLSLRMVRFGRSISSQRRSHAS